MVLMSLILHALFVFAVVFSVSVAFGLVLLVFIVFDRWWR